MTNASVAMTSDQCLYLSVGVGMTGPVTGDVRRRGWTLSSVIS